MKAFISYSHRDREAVDRLHTHLATLRREGLIDTWFDRRILPGDSIDDKITSELESCDIFLMMVSPDFLESDYCVDREMRRALERHDSGAARVVPIIIQPCDWMSSPLSELKVLPTDGKPISEWMNENSAYLDVVKELRRMLDVDQVTTMPEPRVFGSSSDPIRKARRYRVKRDFDDIDRSDFRNHAFSLIREYFRSAIAEIDNIDDVRGRFEDISAKSYGCTVVNKALAGGRGTVHITVHCGDDGIFGFGDIYYSFEKHAPTGHVNGSFSVNADEYELYLRAQLNFSFGTDHKERLTPEEVGKCIWDEFIRRAGLSYD